MPAPNPFRGLSSYTREDKDAFFGRDEDLALMLARITSRRTTLLFAGSGVGKTSFLKAKVIPEIEDRYRVFYFSDWGSQEPLSLIDAAITGANSSHDSGAHRPTRGTVLILDQFEELFQSQLEVERFDQVIEGLAGLVNDADVNISVVFAMREEFLGELSAFDNKIPDVFANYYRLKNPTRKQAMEIIRATARSSGIPASKDLDRLLRDLTFAGLQGSKSGYRTRETISPPYLQIACQRLWEKQPPTVETGFPAGYLDNAASSAIGDYCTDHLNPLPARDKEVISESMGFLITRQGAKMAYELTSLAGHMERRKAQVAAALRKLSDPKIRILREYRSRSAETWFELYHDMYAPFLSEWNAQYRKEQKKLLQKAQATLLSGAHDVPELTRLYNFPTEFTGKGQTIGLIELGGGYRDSDLHSYFSGLGIRSPDVRVVGVDGATNSPGSLIDSEVTMNIDVVGAVAPDAKIVVYFAPNTSEGFAHAISAAAHDSESRVSILAIGWGSPESTWVASAMAAMDSSLKEAASSGITVIVASGDNGVTDGVPGGAHVSFPASSPWVLAVGGTKLIEANNKIAAETVWNNGSGGATGGGVSAIHVVPQWQSALNIVSIQSGMHGRAIPDVAASADPGAGYKIFLNGKEAVLGGTTTAACLWAGLIALVNQGLGYNVGYLNPALYSTLGPRGVLTQITQGDNSVGKVKGYSAGPGWNACTGWGSPDGRKFLAALKEIGPRGLPPFPKASRP
jgi:hypothetical protein